MPSSKTVIVTGASKGIGAAIAVDLDARGYDVVGLSRTGRTPAGCAIVCDMTDEAAVKAAIADAVGSDGLAGLVNNAGLYISEHSAELSTEDFLTVMSLNATAVMIASREAYPHFKANGGGRIVNIGSFFDKMGVPNNLAYCASKAAVGAMTRCLAAEWAKDNITTIDIAPGYIETELNRDYLSREKVKAWLADRIPTGEPGKPEDVAKLVGAVMAGDIPFLTGETIYIDGGQGINH